MARAAKKTPVITPMIIPRTPWREIPPEHWEIVKAYEKDGLSIRQIAFDYSIGDRRVSSQRIHQILQKYNVVMRPGGAPPSKKVKRA